MKKRLVAYLMVSALAVSVLAGCGGKGKGGDAGDAADAGTGEAAVVEEAVEETVEVDDASAALTAAIEEAAAIADTGAAIAADTAVEAAVEEYVDDEVIEEAGDAATEAAAAVDAAMSLKLPITPFPQSTNSFPVISCRSTSVWMISGIMSPTSSMVSPAQVTSRSRGLSKKSLTTVSCRHIRHLHDAAFSCAA